MNFNCPSTTRKKRKLSGGKVIRVCSFIFTEKQARNGVVLKRTEERRRDAARSHGREHARAAHRLDLLLGLPAEEARLDDHGLLGQDALAQNLQEMFRPLAIVHSWELDYGWDHCRIEMTLYQRPCTCGGIFDAVSEVRVQNQNP